MNEGSSSHPTCGLIRQEDGVDPFLVAGEKLKSTCVEKSFHASRGRSAGLIVDIDLVIRLCILTFGVDSQAAGLNQNEPIVISRLLEEDLLP